MANGNKKESYVYQRFLLFLQLNYFKFDLNTNLTKIIGHSITNYYMIHQKTLVFT